MKNQYLIRFPKTKYKQLSLLAGEKLIDGINSLNSPILFGCRTGICGTCLVNVNGDGPLVAPSKQELEILEAFEVDSDRYRLACQLKSSCDMTIEVR